MKTKLSLLFLFVALPVWGQYVTNTFTTNGVSHYIMGGGSFGNAVPWGSSPNQGWLALIPAVVPLLVALGKALTDKLPSWSLPIVAAGLGELLNYVSGLAGGPTTTLANGLILGAAGTGLREIVDQVKNRVKEGKPTDPA